MKSDEFKNLSLARIVEKVYNRVKKAKSDKSQLGMNTAKEAAQMEVLTEVRSTWNKSIDKLIE